MQETALHWQSIEKGEETKNNNYNKKIGEIVTNLDSKTVLKNVLFHPPVFRTFLG